MYKIFGLIIALGMILGITIFNQDLAVAKEEVQANSAVNSEVNLAVNQPVQPSPSNNSSLLYNKVDYSKILDSDIVLGNRKAKNYIIIYTSLTCPHCADFNARVFPIIKAELIDTHKIAYTNRSFLSDKVALAGTMLAFCNGEENYYTMLKVLFSKTDYWVMNDNYTQALEKIASLAGVGAEKFHQCINNKDLQDNLVSSQREAIEQLDIRAIPIIIINGHKYQGALSYDKIKQKLDL